MGDDVPVLFEPSQKGAALPIYEDLLMTLGIAIREGCKSQLGGSHHPPRKVFTSFSEGHTQTPGRKVCAPLHSP